ncbi:MAG: hypothetical protein ABSG21_16390 [Spirochaetia bacterium]|jgi:hypothetical protein
MKKFTEMGRSAPVEHKAIREDPAEGHLECKLDEWRLAGAKPRFRYALYCFCLMHTKVDSTSQLDQVVCSNCHRSYEIDRDKAVENGKIQIAAWLREEANKEGIKLANVRWWGRHPSGQHSLEASNAHTRKTADVEFASLHLTHSKVDNQMKTQVMAKIAGLLSRLQKNIGAY